MELPAACLVGDEPLFVFQSMAKKAAKPTAPTWRNRIVGQGVQPASQFLANPSNARIHPKAQQAALTGSLNEIGWIQNVIVNKTTGNVVDGHARIAEALKIGDETPVPFVEVELTEAEEKLALATLDPISAMAAYDKAQLDALLHEVNTGDAALQTMLSELASDNGLDYGGSGGAAVEDVEPQIDRAAELQVKWGTQRGQLWRLGEHRLLCGDSTNAEDVARVMGGEKAAMVYADPPYGIKVVAANESVGGGEAYNIPFGGKKAKGLGSIGGAKPFGSKASRNDVRGSNAAANIVSAGKYAPIIGDESTDTAVKSSALLLEMFPSAVHIWWGANHYADKLKASSCWVVWNKEATGNFSDCELAWTNQPKAARLFTHRWNGMLRDSERERRIHPSQKPVALAEWCYKELGKDGDIVLDPFTGCAPSLIACENTKRRFFGIEMSEDYIALALERWSTATGKTPELIP